MMHQVILASIFVAMLFVPCLVTLRQGDTSEQDAQ